MSAFLVGTVAALAIVSVLFLSLLGRRILPYLIALVVITAVGAGIYFSLPWLSNLPTLKEQKLLEGVGGYPAVAAAVSAVLLILLLFNRKWGWATFLFVAVLLASVAYKIWGVEHTAETGTDKTAVVEAEKPKPQEMRYAHVSAIPQKTFGAWRISLGAKWFPEFCPPRSNSNFHRLDVEVGVTMWAKNLKGEERTFYIPPGPELLEIKDGRDEFIPHCLTFKADRPIDMLVEIRRRS